MKIALSFLHLVARQAPAQESRTVPGSHHRIIRMKTSLIVAMLGLASITFSACQDDPRRAHDQFTEKTHRVYNPETGSFEQSPPYGKQSNKPDVQ
jgi:hypothetical protein